MKTYPQEEIAPNSIPRGITAYHLICQMLLALAANILNADGAVVSGDVSGVWTSKGGPYILAADGRVVPGAMLTIQPGATVHMAPGVKLTVNGQLVAKGTAAERIQFKAANNAFPWDTILIDRGGNSVSELTYCDFTGATNALTLQIVNQNATCFAIVENCRFDQCIEFGVSGYAHGYISQGMGGIFSYRPTLITSVKNCLFQNSGGGCRYDTEGTQNLLSQYGFVGNLVSGFVTNQNNIYRSLRGAGVSIRAEAHTRTSQAIVENNTFHGMGVGVQGSQLVSADIKNNIFNGCDTGISRNTTSGETSYNCFANGLTNFVGYSPNYGKLLLVNGNGTPCDIAFNIFQTPQFKDNSSLLLATGSPCIDAGDPSPQFSESCTPPALGNSIADMGAYGGPGACTWPRQVVPPTIVTAPTPQSSCEGGDVSFVVSAIGDEPLQYQWLFNGIAIQSATSASYTLTNITTGNTGTYSVVVSNAGGSVTSATATLSLFDACVDLKMYAGLNISGQEGETYILKFTTDVANTNFQTWTAMATNRMQKSGWFYLDLESPLSPKKYYGVRKMPR